MQLEKVLMINKWSLTCFKSILKILHSNYFKFCSNLLVKFAFLLKSDQRFNISIVFPVYKQSYKAQ